MKKMIAEMAQITEASLLQDSTQQIKKINLEENLITSSILLQQHSIYNLEEDSTYKPNDGVCQYIRYTMGGQNGARISQFPISSISI
jgi:hypothetical protein